MGKMSVTSYPTKLSPGRVLILTAGKYAGKRVVLLKTLTEGLLLISGPFRVNGVPLRRVHFRYAKPTSTVIDISGVKVDSINDSTFAEFKVAKEARKATLTKDDFLSTNPPPRRTVSDSFKKLQQDVDYGLEAAI